MNAESTETVFSLVKRVARRIRYREFDALIDKTVSVSSMESTEAEITSFVQQFSPDSEYRPGEFRAPIQTPLSEHLLNTEFSILNSGYRIPFLLPSSIQKFLCSKNWDFSRTLKKRRIRRSKTV